LNCFDIFSGIGGMSLGMEKAGMKTIAFCEIGKMQQEILKRNWPGIPIFNDIREIKEIDANIISKPDIIAGGDPCPIRSRARSNGASKHPDLSGYFLALVGKLRPKWVVRENVLASDDFHFASALEFLGYRTVIVRTDAATITGQSRQRDFIIGCSEETGPSFQRFIQNFQHGSGTYKTRLDTRPVIPALTTHRTRYDSRDCYIWEEKRGLRILDSEEREAFAGFPKEWLTGLSEAACAKLFGNSIVPKVAYIIGKAIMESESNATN